MDCISRLQKPGATPIGGTDKGPAPRRRRLKPNELRNALDDEGQAHEIWSMSQLMPGVGISDGVDRIHKALRALAGMQDAPVAFKPTAIPVSVRNPNPNIAGAVAEWRDMSAAAMRLRCGELTAQEIRTVRAVLSAILPKV